MIKGITEKENIIIDKILNLYEPEFKFYFFGSRVKGDFSKLSDLDILIKGEKEIPSNYIDTLKTLFDKSDLPYIVNLTDFYGIDEKFYNLIRNDLILHK